MSSDIQNIDMHSCRVQEYSLMLRQSAVHYIVGNTGFCLVFLLLFPTQMCMASMAKNRSDEFLGHCLQHPHEISSSTDTSHVKK